jgi:magnesium-transporting ATPase (P-type)
MEFKYMLVGSTFYGEKDKFEQVGGAEHGRNERSFYEAKKADLARDSYVNPDQELQNWRDGNFENAMAGRNNPQINLTLKSSDPSITFPVTTQRDHISEFMKVLSLAHMCVPEFFNDGKEKFYNGPSPDEVALVEFAAS